ncbi:hypothetical protein, partial [Proteus faecis]|uniref:hypothetical protein n=1 Tax=Proteus faecis TaxID=2050967 RepID=UPI003075B3E5
ENKPSTSKEKSTETRTIQKDIDNVNNEDSDSDNFSDASEVVEESKYSKKGRNITKPKVLK